jgi:hypothetical protein
MVITNEAVKDGDDTPVLKPGNVKVTQGKAALKVTQVIPAQAENAALQLFILIDETCDTNIGNNLSDIRDFINAQPATTTIAIGYMSNANVQMAQDFTTDHSLAAKAIRLPRGRLSAMDSPYLSLMSLVRRWPEGKVRREIIMVTDGIDRLRGEREAGGNPNRSLAPTRSPSSTPRSNLNTVTPLTGGMAVISTDATPASELSQRYGVIVHGIYSRGVGRLGRNAWEEQLGQAGVARISEETGGEYFALGTSNAVSFKPYFDSLKKILDNQYYLVFQAVPKKKSGLQRVKISTEAFDTEIAAADNVWVPATNEANPSGN